MPTAHAHAAILSVGDELILGQSLDTNTRWIADRLLDLGVRPLLHATAPDDRADIAAEMVRLAGRADLVVVTGGLGPTADDLTRDALADATGEALVEDSDTLGRLAAWYEGRGQPMPAPNRVQAMRPARARCLPNDHGTAPGLSAALGGADIFCLPGPPGEMRPMFQRFVEPALRPGLLVRTRAVQVFGLGESRVAELLGDLMRRENSPLVGTTASVGLVTVRMRWESAPGAPPDAAAGALDRVEARVRELLGDAVITPSGAPGDRGLPEVVVGMLRERGRTLAIAESCTGGLLGSMVTRVPGSSEVFAGGWITYTNAMKAAQLGVDASHFPEVRSGAPGAVSAEVCLAMAEGARRRAATAHPGGSGPGAGGTDHAIAITGIAGPGGATEGKPVGTVWIGLADRDGRTECRRFEFAGDRDAVRQWSAMTALGMLRMRLAGTDMELLRQRERRP
jgi:nicotinamide-nucleotide amidase